MCCWSEPINYAYNASILANFARTVLDKLGPIICLVLRHKLIALELKDTYKHNKRIIEN